GRIPAHKVPQEMVEKIIGLRQKPLYQKSNFAHFRDLLEDEGISYSYSTIYKILRTAGFTSPKRRRTKKERLHRPRARRPHFGELLQADASSFDWFGTGRNSTIHGFLDDATGKITGLYLCENECLLGYL